MELQTYSTVVWLAASLHTTHGINNNKNANQNYEMMIRTPLYCLFSFCFILATTTLDDAI